MEQARCFWIRNQAPQVDFPLELIDSHNCTLICLILVYLFSILSALGSSVLLFLDL